MTWTNALSIGYCSLSFRLNGEPVTIDELVAAGITIDTADGVITATWDGVTGSPNALQIDVTPSYDISSLDGQIADVSVASPLLGGCITSDGTPGTFEYSPFSDLPWGVTPQAASSIGCYAASGE